VCPINLRLTPGSAAFLSCFSVLLIVELVLVRHSPGVAELGSAILVVIMVLSWGPGWPTFELARFRRHHHERTACT
jgi:hypothetical protein